MPLAELAEQYFSNINPIASRIYADFEDTKNAYECVWSTLSFDEQSQILNECIIKPEITLQYNLKSSDCAQTNSSERFAHKRIVDENVSYRDEHSAPFSFKTQSQLDLRMFQEEQVKKIHVTPKIELPKIQPKAETPIMESSTARYKTDTSIFGKLLGRRQSPDAEQEVLVSPESTNGTVSSSIGLRKSNSEKEEIRKTS